MPSFPSSSPKLPSGYRLLRLEAVDSTNAEARRRAHERCVQEHPAEDLELDGARRRPEQALQREEPAHRWPLARRLGRWAGHGSPAD